MGSFDPVICRVTYTDYDPEQGDYTVTKVVRLRIGFNEHTGDYSASLPCAWGPHMAEPVVYYTPEQFDQVSARQVIEAMCKNVKMTVHILKGHAHSFYNTVIDVYPWPHGEGDAVEHFVGVIPLQGDSLPDPSHYPAAWGKDVVTVVPHSADLEMAFAYKVPEWVKELGDVPPGIGVPVKPASDWVEIN